MNRSIRYILLWFSLGSVTYLGAAEPTGVQRKKIGGFRTAEACLPPSASSQLDVNNVRALLHNGGDMWWDLVGDPRYEVPKGSNRHSMFASSLWIGGFDGASQLRVAGQTYRQSGIDFWPGPLTGGPLGGLAATERETCTLYDKMFKINKAEIDAFLAAYANRDVEPFSLADFPNVRDWPAIGNPNSSLGLDDDGITLEAFRADGSLLYAAPFVNVDNDPFTYDPTRGDYPLIDGDQAIWWIINDKGDVHTETGGEPIGIEIHILAFAFTTANAVNDMTFYRQTVVNRASQVLNQTYMGQWVDVDVGFAFNDWVGCDTTRGLGYGFNATAVDQGANGYGANPPACGVDFFQGPLADPFDGVDNDKDGVIDEPGETIIMSKFVYYNNDFSLTGNPEVAQHFYGYLTGFWKDGTPIVDNYSNGGPGNGYGPAGAGDPTSYMFSGDPCAGTGWTEANANNATNQDRRFLQSAGPFTLQPGAVNEIVTGVVWARGFYNGQFGSVCELLAADDIAQALFDNNFVLLDGPDAPELAVSEYSQELLLSWGYPEAFRNVRNNYNESYVQADPVLKAEGVADSIFRFQGYILYQMADITVGPNELNDPDRARILAQCDVKDGVGTIVNRIEQQVEGLSLPIIIDEVMVQGADNGIFNSIRVDRDLFAQAGDSRLKNYTTYYYAVVAYAYNDTSSDGRRFVQGNRFFRVVPAMPHPIEFEQQGTVVATTYGDGIPLSMTAGVGNGGRFLSLDENTVDAILASGSTGTLNFVDGAGPIQVKVTDPKQVRGAYYRLRVPGNQFEEIRLISRDTISGITVVDSIFAEWILEESDTESGPYARVFASTYSKRNDGTVARPQPLVGTERVVPERGFSIVVENVTPAGDTNDVSGNTGVIGGRIVFDDPSQAWLTGLPDFNEFEPFNWIRGGPNASSGRGSGDGYAFRNQGIYDKNGDFQTILSGRWAPFALARAFNNDLQGGGQIAPGLPIRAPSGNRQVDPAELINLANLPDVDIVFTSDITKWSRCVVVETSPNSGLGSGAWQLSAKWRDNVNQEGLSEGIRTRDDHGMGWFPGYAINVSTGERLNVFFGESSWDKLNRGDDMLFNPTGEFGANLDRVGGRHYVYVTNLPYDGCESIRGVLQNGNDLPEGNGSFSDAIFFPSTGNNIKDAYKHVAWVGIPLAAPGYDVPSGRDIPTDATVSLRTRKSFGPREGSTESPIFEFNTVDLAARNGDLEVAKDALEKVLVVPNPYYAYSSYELGQLDNRVKITNLPQKCRISIFTLNGNLVRQFTKDSDEPDQDWDLKNTVGVPVASGVYIIHVDANIDGLNLGEKVIKLFAVMRQIDLDSY